VKSARLALARARDAGDWLDDEPGWKEPWPSDAPADETESPRRREGDCFTTAPDVLAEGCLHGGSALGDLHGCDLPAIDCGGGDVLSALDCGGCG
jgi:hypothetical protein